MQMDSDSYSSEYSSNSSQEYPRNQYVRRIHIGERGNQTQYIPRVKLEEQVKLENQSEPQYYDPKNVPDDRLLILYRSGLLRIMEQFEEQNELRFPWSWKIFQKTDLYKRLFRLGAFPKTRQLMRSKQEDRSKEDQLIQDYLQQEEDLRKYISDQHSQWNEIDSKAEKLWLDQTHDLEIKSKKLKLGVFKQVDMQYYSRPRKGIQKPWRKQYAKRNNIRAKQYLKRLQQQRWQLCQENEHALAQKIKNQKNSF